MEQVSAASPPGVFYGMCGNAMSLICLWHLVCPLEGLHDYVLLKVSRGTNSLFFAMSKWTAAVRRKDKLLRARPQETAPPEETEERSKSTSKPFVL